MAQYPIDFLHRVDNRRFFPVTHPAAIFDGNDNLYTILEEKLRQKAYREILQNNSIIYNDIFTSSAISGIGHLVLGLPTISVPDGIFFFQIYINNNGHDAVIFLSAQIEFGLWVGGNAFCSNNSTIDGHIVLGKYNNQFFIVFGRDSTRWDATLFNVAHQSTNNTIDDLGQGHSLEVVSTITNFTNQFKIDINSEFRVSDAETVGGYRVDDTVNGTNITDDNALWTAHRINELMGDGAEVTVANHNSNVAAHPAIQAKLAGKADLISGKVPVEQLPITELLEDHNANPDAHTVAMESKANVDSPALTGTPTAPTVAQTVSNDQLATTQYVHDGLATKQTKFSLSANLTAGTIYYKIGEIDGDFGPSGIVIYVNGIGKYEELDNGMDIVYLVNTIPEAQATSINGYNIIPTKHRCVNYAIQMGGTNKRGLWIKQDGYCQQVDIIVAQAIMGTQNITVGNLVKQTTVPADYLTYTTFVTLYNSDNLKDATKTEAGLMSAADKTNLDGLIAGELLKLRTVNGIAPDSNGNVTIGVEDIQYTKASMSGVSNLSEALDNLQDNKAPLNSPQLTGTPTAPTVAQTVNNDQLATTEYVQTGLTNMQSAVNSSTQTMVMTHNNDKEAHSTKADISTSVLFTLIAANWIGDEAPYKQTITLNKVSINGIVAVATTATIDEVEQLRNALLRITNQTTTTISFEADGAKPKLSIPMNLINLG